MKRTLICLVLGYMFMFFCCAIPSSSKTRNTNRKDNKTDTFYIGTTYVIIPSYLSQHTFSKKEDEKLRAAPLIAILPHHNEDTEYNEIILISDMLLRGFMINLKNPVHHDYLKMKQGDGTYHIRSRKTQEMIEVEAYSISTKDTSLVRSIVNSVFF